MIPLRQRPLLIVLSAPSGGGKTTLGEALLRRFPGMRRSISCTTRPPRPGEQDGRDYHFLSESEFQARARAGDLLEQARVHAHAYGTPRGPVLEALAEGRDILLTIDVQGAARVRDLVARGGPDDPLRRALVDVFVAPPDRDTLRRRLLARGTDDAAALELRLKNAELEVARWREYRYGVVNDRLEDAIEDLAAIVRAEHCRTEGDI
jgi:guanylate kinase